MARAEPSEQQRLVAIESRLRRSDPQLTEMFAAFTSQPALRQGPVRERLTPWRPPGRKAVVRKKDLRKAALVVVLACMLIGSMVAGVVKGGHQDGPSSGGFPTAVWGRDAYR